MQLRLSFLSKELTEFFRKMVHDVMNLRASTGVTRKDFMQLLIELKDTGRLSHEVDETVEKMKTENLDNGYAHVDNSSK